MIERGVITEELLAPDADSSPPPESLEQRVRRLEDAVAGMQDTRTLEERVVERVITRVKNGTPSAPAAEPPSLLAHASRKLLPAAIELVRTQVAEPPPAPAAAVPVARRWLLFDIYADVRTLCRMYVDRRYRVSWSALVVPVAALVLFLLSWLIISGLWVVGPLLDKVFDLLLGFVVYKVLVREIQRYRQAVANPGSPGGV